MIIVKIRAQYPTQGLFIEDDDMVETLPTDRADHALHVSMLPRRPRSAEELFDSHHFYLFSELESVNPIAISQEIFRRRVEGKSFDDLLCGPLCSWMSGHVEMDDPPAIVRKHDKNEQNLEPDRVYGEEFDRNQ